MFSSVPRGAGGGGGQGEVVIKNATSEIWRIHIFTSYDILSISLLTSTDTFSIAHKAHHVQCCI